ncbi:uncharacterized protein LOC125676871 isoform X2 [Ostrea edulis]|uniref:uncharacterized protein LOC125676871 isoform X2 n=1 Tax=Ostrea edulis TaxID=37623 RepID=UPI0020958C58|nr:uncharacterized protein LOC125676871 isoform X2 [Ostrea edulis]
MVKVLLISTPNLLNLPYGKYLSDKELHHDLVKIFTLYAEQSDRLSSLESTQNNENFNQIVARKNPKNNFYSGSESTTSRVAAATCEKNIGPHYVTQINDELSLSPRITKRTSIITAVSKFMEER